MDTNKPDDHHKALELAAHIESINQVIKLMDVAFLEKVINSITI